MEVSCVNIEKYKSEYYPRVEWNNKTRIVTLDWTKFLGYPNVQTLATWDQGLKVNHFVDGVEEVANLCSIGEIIFSGQFKGLNHILSSIPNDILKGFKLLPIQDFHILGLAATHQSVAELLARNPLLLWFAFSHSLRKGYRKQDFLALVECKQKVIAERTGIRGGKQSARILKKFSTEKMHLKSIGDLFRLLENSSIRHYLSHRSAPTKLEIRVLTKFPWLVDGASRALIPQLNRRSDFQLLQDIVNMSGATEILLALSTLNSVGALHDRLVANQINQGPKKHYQRNKHGNVVLLPRQPLPNSKNIVALTSQLAILEEGASMRHCVGSYIARILGGKYYVYSMVSPERLTIGLRVTSSGIWVLDQLKGRRNAKPRQISVELVENWLFSAQTFSEPSKYSS